MKKIKIIIFDDSEEIRDYFENIINEQSNMEIVGSFDCGKNAVEVVKSLQPDVVLMDIQMETEDAGIKATEQINQFCPGVKIIMLTVHCTENFIIDSYVAGAVDYIDKMSEKNVLLESINNVYKNDKFIGNVITEKLKILAKNRQEQKKSILFLINNYSKLSVSELEVLRLLCQGYSRREISKIKQREYSTIKTQIRSILMKLEFSSTKELLNFFEENGLFSYVK